MNVVPNPKLYEDLDKFFAQRTIGDVDRSTFLICNLKDNDLKITISLVFLKDWDSLPTNDYNAVTIDECGAVFTFPCYWVSVPKELCIPYFTTIIDLFYKEVVSKWDIASNAGSTGTGSSSGTGTNLPCNGNQNGCCCK